MLDGALEGAGRSRLSEFPHVPPPAHTGAEAAAPAEAAWAVRHCRPPVSLCGLTVRELEHGGTLDFRARADVDTGPPRLLSPFAVVRIEALDRTRCPGKLCAAHVALAGLLEELLKQGYHTHSVAVQPGSATITLRSERIDRALKVLKGSCRFNLDLGCFDFDAWLQDDRKSGEQCGFAQTRVFVVAANAPAFVPAAGFVPAGGGARAGAEALRVAAFDAAGVKVYEMVYVHKICRNDMSLVRNG